MCRDVCFGLDMYVLCAVKSRGAARTNSVGPKDLNSFLFQGFIADKVVKVVRSEVGDCTTI